MLRPALIIHGGAGRLCTELADAQRAGCAAALEAGWRVLCNNGSALDAVCAAVASLETDPTFNAGRGSALTAAGTVEMDAAVMEGSGLRAGAVAVVSGVPNPVRLARAVMEDGRHVMLAGADAEVFANAHGVATCRPEDLITPEQLERWHEWAEQDVIGTVGAAAADHGGHVAAATSTGGIFYKLPGRIGDSAILGAGTYADDRSGAASATGEGEAIMRVVLAKSVLDSLRDGCDPSIAAQQGIVLLQRRTAGSGGIVVVDPLGRFGYASNTETMVVGYMRPDLPGPVLTV